MNSEVTRSRRQTKSENSVSVLTNISKKPPQVDTGVRKKPSATSTSKSFQWRATKAGDLRSYPLATDFEDPEKPHKDEHNTMKEG